MRATIAALVLFAAQTAQTATAETTKDAVLACFAGMGTTTEWSMCLGTMFAPCESHKVGGEAHLTCLGEQRDIWQDAKRTIERDVLDALDPNGIAALSGFMLSWPDFVDDKCEVVATRRAEISFDAAYLGCQISEYALMTNELTACANDLSTEAYCKKK